MVNALLKKWIDDGLVCTTDECNEIGCVYTYNEEPCDDGNPNTIGDKCKDGVCVPELPFRLVPTGAHRAFPQP